MRIALDTNVLAYAEGVNGSTMKNAALSLVERLPQESVALPVQAVCELFQVLVRKAGCPTSQARAAILSWCDAFPLIDTSSAVLLGAMDLSVTHKLATWDAVILSSAAEAGCRLLLSEDMQDGFTWRGVTVTNPFAKRLHPLLKSILE